VARFAKGRSRRSWRPKIRSQSRMRGARDGLKRAFFYFFLEGGDDEASRSMLGLCERQSAARCPGSALGASAARAGEQEQVGGPGEAVDSPIRRDAGAGLLHVEVAGADDHIDGAAPGRLPLATGPGDRLRAAHGGAVGPLEAC